MKTFLVYTLARLGLFLGVYGVLWLGLSQTVAWDSISGLYTALIAWLVSSLLAVIALRRQRSALAAEIAARNHAAASSRTVVAPNGGRTREAASSRAVVSPQSRNHEAGEDAGGVPQLGQPGVSQDDNQR